jgi:eukaryotic-like serine/threonine-protein kinase
MLVDRNGRETPLGVEPRGYRFPAVSPDGRWLAVTVDPQPPQIWVIDLLRESAQPVSTAGDHLQPVWDPIGSRLAFSTNPGAATIEWPVSGALRQVMDSAFLWDWPRAGTMLIGSATGKIRIHDLITHSLAPWPATAASELESTHSPDGRWVAYVSTLSGTPEIYGRELGGRGPDVLVSQGGGAESVWSMDGSEIFYRNGSSIASVRVRTTTRFEVVGPPQVLFSEDYDFSNDSNWDVLPDGRFVMIRSSPGVGREIRVISNWLN